MYNFGPYKTFKDAVHGYINIPKIFVDEIIDTAKFQRLRNITQTGMMILYPNAKHDRFSHSLGVFYLGHKAAQSLLHKIIKKEEFKISNGGNEHQKFYLKVEILFLLACILHDVGHAPYSHSLELQILENSQITEVKRKKGVTKTVGEQLIESINSSEENTTETQQIKKINAAPHEQLGALYILKNYKNTIKKILKYIFDLNDMVIDNNEIDEDICFIVRMIMGLKYENWDKKYQIKNCFIELLNGDNFDVDKLDYIIRDTNMSGISNVAVDVERLIGSLCIITKTKQYDKSLKGKQIDSIIATHLENNKENKIVIEGKIIGTILVKKNSKIYLKEGSQIQKLCSEDITSARVSYLTGDNGVFSAESNIIDQEQGSLGVETIQEFSKEAVKQVRGKVAKNPFGIYIENAFVKKDFNIKAEGNVRIQFNGKVNIVIEGEFLVDKPIKISHIKNIDGKIYKLELLGDAFKEKFTTIKVSTQEGYNTYSIGFKKQAINCIASVLDARNFLYLWVYAHHKVIYYANFLIPVIAKDLSTKINDKKIFPYWKLNYLNLEKLDDSYVWTAIKYCYAKNKNGATEKLVKQLTSRKYAISLYKSLAEFETIFALSPEKIEIIYNRIIKSCIDKRKPYIKENGNVAGYLKNEEIKKINEEIQNYVKEYKLDEKYKALVINDMIFVPANYKQKN